MNSKTINYIFRYFTLVFFYASYFIACFDVKKGIYNRWNHLQKTNNDNDNNYSKNLIHQTESFLNNELNNNKLQTADNNIINKFLKSTEKNLRNKKILENLQRTTSLGSIEKQSDYKELFAEVKIDHFSYENQQYFKLRYLIKDQYFDYSNPNSPILFYCGNEGPIEDFYKNSGFITDYLARKYRALVIFGEHRFFGKSFPFGNKQDKDINKNKYLTSEQALSDFVELLVNFKKEKNLIANPIIAFGGSYGGMLSSWARMKFPHIFQGAVASSAPVLLFEDINKIQNSFFKIVTKTYERYDAKCPTSIREGFQKLFDFRNFDLIGSNPSVHETLNEIFKPCKKIENVSDIKKLEDIIEDMIITLAQYNYPYETSFIKPTPAEPVKVACERIAQIRNNSDYFFNLSPIISSSLNFAFNKYNQVDIESKYKLKYLKAAIDVFFNYTESEKCLDIGNDDKSQAQDLNGWSYMACSEMIMPMQKNGITDMFNPLPWNLADFAYDCKKSWNTDVRPDWIYNFYGGRDFYKEINEYSNIVYINGKMDPWNAGCPTFSNNPKVLVFEADSAHHLDLRLPNEKDPESIVEARKLIELLLEKWINEKNHK